MSTRSCDQAPGLLPLRGRLLRARLDGYLDGIVGHDFEELGQTVRRPQLLRRWMAALSRVPLRNE
jgi:hypothetical protein